MANFYPYLVSSLPMLHFGNTPPFSFEKFIEMCKDQITEEELSVIELTKDIYAAECAQPTLVKWRIFDTALRNELVKIRASRKRLDPLKYVRGGDGYIESYITHIALGAYRNPSIIEAEKFLDRERWRVLDEFTLGHYFDLDVLIVYALQLLILARWVRINSADKSQLLEEVLS